MPKIDTEILVDIATKWMRVRIDFQNRSGQPQPGEVREFFDKTNGLSMQLMSALNVRNDDVLVAFGECATNAAAVLRNREVG